MAAGPELPNNRLLFSALPEFDRSCTLRRSLSDRVAVPMANPARFQDTTKLSQKSRSRGSLHNLFRMTAGRRNSGSSGADGPTAATPSGRFPLTRIMRPKIPPPPPPAYASAFRAEEPALTPAPPVTTAVAPPVAPPRRIFRFSRADLDTLSQCLSHPPRSVDSSPEVTEAVDPSSAVTSWACRPLSGQVNE